MANTMYAKALEAFLNGDIDWANDTIKAVLVDGADYTPNLSTHDFLDDVPSGARIGTPQTLSGKTSTGGVADANDITFPTVTGDQAEYILIYKDTGSEATSPLIMLIDSATGLPVTPGGGDIPITWNATGIFKL